MQDETYLQKRDHKTDDRVAAQSTGIHLVHASLAQECLDHQDQLSCARQDIEILIDYFAGRDTVDLVERNVDIEPSYQAGQRTITQVVRDMYARSPSLVTNLMIGTRALAMMATVSAILA